MFLAHLDLSQARGYESVSDVLDVVARSPRGVDSHTVYGRLGAPIRFWQASGADGSGGISCAPAEASADDVAQLLVAVNRLYGRAFTDAREAREFLFSQLGSPLSVVLDEDAINDAFSRAAQVLQGDEMLSRRWDVRDRWLDGAGHVAVVELSFAPFDDDEIERLAITMAGRGFAELLAINLAPTPMPVDERLVWRLPTTAHAMHALRDEGMHVPHVLIPVEGLDWLMVVHPADEVALVVGAEALVADYAQDMRVLIEEFEAFFLHDPRRPQPDADWPMLRHLQWMRDYAARH